MKYIPIIIKKIKLKKKNINEMPCMQADTQNEYNPNRQNKTYSNPNSLVKIQYNQNTTKSKEPN